METWAKACSRPGQLDLPRKKEVKGFLPSGCGEGGKEVVVVGLVGDEEKFGAWVGVVKLLAKLGGDDGVLCREDDGDRALEIFKPNPSRVLVAHDPTDGEDWIMVLRDIGEAVKRGEEEKSFGAVGVCRSGGGGDAGADGFTKDNEGHVVGDQAHRFIRRAEKIGLRGLPGPRAVAGIFEDVDRKSAIRCGVAQNVCIVHTMRGVTGVTVRDENGGGWSCVVRRGRAKLTDGLAGGISPRLEPADAGFAFERFRVVA